MAAQQQPQQQQSSQQQQHPAGSGGGYLVPVEVRPCSDQPAKGCGVFAQRHIPKGTLLWQPTSVRMLPAAEAAAQLAGMPREQAQTLLRQSFVAPSDAGALCVNPDDNGRFTNHAPGPQHNVGACVDACADSFALRDIAAGEELLCDYSGFANPDWYVSLCKEYGVLTTAEVVAMAAATQSSTSSLPER